MRNFEPALGYSAKKIEAKSDFLFNNSLTKLSIWQPSKAWAIILGVAFAIGIMSLQGLSVFLYWQF
jgi:hypothetical protein